MTANQHILHDLTPQDVQTQIEAEAAILIDVREANEYVAERILGALLVPLSQFNPAHLPLDTDRRIIFHCAAGVRSAKAAAMLAEAGVTESAHLAGGMKAWKQAGLPYVTTDPASGQPQLVRP